MHSISSTHKLLRTSLEKYRPFSITEVRAFSPSSIHTISRPQICKYFSQVYLSHNHFIINALQNLLFCIPKAAVLQRKTYAFTVQNSCFRNAKSKLAFSEEIIFTKSRLFLCVGLKFYGL